MNNTTARVLHDGHCERWAQLSGLWLATRTPCHCRRRIKLRAIDGVPRETYARICRVCGAKWDIERTEIRNADGIRMDQLDWTRVA